MLALCKDNIIVNKNKCTYNVGIYVRLSKEDEDTLNESESITNQKDFLTRYVVEQGWNLVDIFIDDGYTGTNFNRPGFQSLIKSVEDRRVNLVITKDLSRLGRDYIETGHYIERYFPQHNVRYIAVTDGVDTFETNNSNNEMSPIKSFFNDFYAKDISKKVRNAMNTKQRNGKFIGAFAPYGYLKSPMDKNKLVVDPETAPTVKQIFELYVAGHGFTYITHVLNDQGVLCPSLHKAQNTNYKCRSNELVGLWTIHTIKAILKNPTYAGNLTQNKCSSVSYKVQKLRNNPRESWITVQGTHEPIVDIETFQLTQQVMSAKAVGKINMPSGIHLLGGLVYCKDCGSKMTFTKTQKGEIYFVCSKYKRFKSKYCTRHSYKESELEQHILGDLRRIARDIEVNQEELLRDAREISGKQKKVSVNKTAREIETTEKRLLEIRRNIKSLYADKLKGILTEQDFIDLSNDFNKERERLTDKLSRLSKEVDFQKQTKEVEDELLKIIRNLIEFKDVPKAVLIKLIKRIEISEDKSIDIYYKFKLSH